MRRLVLAAALIAAAALVTPSPTRGQSEAQRAALTQALGLVERASQAAGAEQTTLARAALNALDGNPELARSAWLRDPLAADPPDLARGQARLTAALASLGGATSSVSDLRTARATLADILAGPPFQAWSWLALLPAFLLPIALVIQAILQAIWNAMRWPFDRFLELLQSLFEGVFFTPAVLAIALILAVLLVLLYRRGLRVAIVAQAEIATGPGELPPTAADALAAAQRHAAEGRYREASHFVFLSTLLWLEERGQARFVPAATNREYLAQIAAQPAVAAALAPVVSRFDRLWYGQDAIDDADYQELVAVAARVREAVA